MAKVDPNDLIGAAEAARYLGLTGTRIYALSKAGKIGRRIGGYWLYTRAELDTWKAQRKPQGGRPKSTRPTHSQ